MQKQINLFGFGATLTITDAQMEQIKAFGDSVTQTVQTMREQGEVKAREFAAQLATEHPETAAKVMAIFTQQSTPSSW